MSSAPYYLISLHSSVDAVKAENETHKTFMDEVPPPPGSYSRPLYSTVGFPERDFGTSAAVMGKPACKDEISYSGRNDMLSEVLASFFCHSFILVFHHLSSCQFILR